MSVIEEETATVPCAACRGTGETDYPGDRPDRCWECKGTGEVDSDG